jgi:hypothetical protein
LGSLWPWELALVPLVPPDQQVPLVLLVLLALLALKAPKALLALLAPLARQRWPNSLV